MLQKPHVSTQAANRTTQNNNQGKCSVWAALLQSHGLPAQKQQQQQPQHLPDVKQQHTDPPGTAHQAAKAPAASSGTGAKQAAAAAGNILLHDVLHLLQPLISRGSQLCAVVMRCRLPETPVPLLQYSPPYVTWFAWVGKLMSLLCYHVPCLRLLQVRGQKPVVPSSSNCSRSMGRHRTHNNAHKSSSSGQKRACLTQVVCPRSSPSTSSSSSSQHTPAVPKHLPFPALLLQC
jgi:hypothetical protein